MISKLLLLAALSAQAPVRAAQSGRPLFEDRQREIEVRYAFTPGNVEFSANLPARWTFSISIDGDQNRRWGNGPEGIATGETSGDRAFAQDSGHGAFCAQYILTTDPGNPEQVHASSDCDGYPSHGRVEMTRPDARGRATITYRIPSAEVFGTHRDARLRACVYDGHRWTCQRWLANLFVLQNPDAASGE